MKEIKLNITGMHCNSCAILIVDSLTEQKGVKDAVVNLKKNSAIVKLDEKLIDEKQLISIIKKEGYDAALAK